MSPAFSKFHVQVTQRKRRCSYAIFSEAIERQIPDSTADRGIIVKKATISSELSSDLYVKQLRKKH